MTYDSSHVFQETVHLLSQKPHSHLTEISKELGIERHTIERSVLQQTRLTFRDYRRSNLALAVTRFMRQHPTVPVKAVADTFGFRSASSFSRMLKNSTGKTPTKLRT